MEIPVCEVVSSTSVQSAENLNTESNTFHKYGIKSGIVTFETDMAGMYRFGSGPFFVIFRHLSRYLSIQINQLLINSFPQLTISIISG
jgi:hypothetical protein